MQFTGHPNKYMINRASPKKMIKKTLDEIDKRRLLAIKMNDISEIEDFNGQVLEIIKDDGLDNESQKVRLDTAFKTMPYIKPQKKAIETTIIVKKIEDIIKESTEEAEFTEIDEKEANK